MLDAIHSADEDFGQIKEELRSLGHDSG